MFGYIYITTNLINGKQYIGKKKSDKFLHEKYLGSGIILRQAIEKEGAENFRVEMLDSADSLEELNKKEKYYIQLYDAVKSSNFYNIRSGGDCGPGGPRFKGHHHSEESRKSMSESRKGSNNSNYGNHWKQSDKLRALHSKLSSGENNGMYGKTHSDETKAKISASNGGRKWMTDGIHLVHIHPEEIEKYIKLGYHLGMK